MPPPSNNRLLQYAASKLAPLRGRAAGKLSEIGNNVVNQFEDVASPLRVRLDRYLPNFDAHMMREDIGSAAHLPGKAQSFEKAMAVLGLTGLSSLKGTRTAARQAFQNSWNTREGFRPGAVAGGAFGALQGGAVGWDQGDDKHRVRNAVMGALSGGALGAAGGGAVTGGATAARAGLKTGLARFNRQMKGWDELMAGGIMPLYASRNDQLENLFNTLKKVRTFGDGRAVSGQVMDEVRNIIRNGDRGYISELTSVHKAKPEAFFTTDLPKAVSDAGLTEIDAGKLVNPKIIDMVQNPKWLSKMREVGVKRIHGRWRGDEILDFRKSDRNNILRKRMNALFTDAVAAGGGFHHNTFKPRTRTGDLQQDIANAAAQAPEYTLGKTLDSTAVNKFIEDLPLARKRRLMMPDEYLRDWVHARAKPGNQSMQRVWTNDKELPFDIDLQNPWNSKIPQVNVRTLDRSPKSLRQRLLEADPSIPKDALSNKNEWPKFPEQIKRMEELQRRISIGEKVDVRSELGDIIGGFSGDELAAEMRAGSARREAARRAAEKPKKPSRYGDIKRGETFKSLLSYLPGAKEKGSKLRDLLPPWHVVAQDKWELPLESLIEENVDTPAKWKQYKRMLMHALLQKGIDLRKSASVRNTLASSALFRLLMAVRCGVCL